MKWKRFNRLCVLLFGCGVLASHAAPLLDLKGYVDDNGAISVLHQGDSSDPYFAMQALLLARDNGMDVTVASRKFIRWLLPRQKPDGTFDRFCRDDSQQWVACQTADADDSMLALWMMLLSTQQTELNSNAAWQKSFDISRASLDRLFQPSRGIYMVSPVYLHGLLMDNLEVWSYLSTSTQPKRSAEAAKLAQSIQETFWDSVNKRFLVSTQLEQLGEKTAFYPDHVAQLFPLLVKFPVASQDEQTYYRQWMRNYRQQWLKQSETDYPWGLVAVLALRENDATSVRCWLRESTPLRHSSRWAVTDEVAYQIVTNAQMIAAPATAVCK
jgi:hypothetical protein